jgi:hypothetical protein
MGFIRTSTILRPRRSVYFFAPRLEALAEDLGLDLPLPNALDIAAPIPEILLLSVAGFFGAGLAARPNFCFFAAMSHFSDFCRRRPQTTESTAEQRELAVNALAISDANSHLYFARIYRRCRRLA